MISSLPLVRYLRSVATKSSSQALNQYKETRPYQTMHSAARSTHLVVNSFLCPEKLAVDPHFFISTHQHHRVIATCYVGPQLCGHAGYVHGGVPFLLFDDLFARCASTLFDSGVAMTANMNIDFRKPAIPDRVYLYRAETVMTEGRKAWLTVSDEVSEEEENEGILVAEATALFVEPKFEKV
ncbi:HotDog domain-containing protein [Aspergillus pseudonomiae]|nr:HotDog domain-containing protein [Aspergillus pseudonomiae]